MYFFSYPQDIFIKAERKEGVAFPSFLPPDFSFCFHLIMYATGVVAVDVTFRVTRNFWN